jgi:hypothetical protein
VERIEEFTGMAGMNTTSATSRQKRAAELVAGYGDEQRRLKAAAAGRRAAAAEEIDRSVSARRWRPPAVAARSVVR